MKKYSLLITDTTLDDMNEIYDCIAKQLLILEAAINRPVNIDSSIDSISRCRERYTTLKHQ